ncbi:MAG: glycosyltransferase [Candidatus Odinarchaeia archaeon]
MKIYFAPNGVALGHAGRCLPIARKLLSLGNKVVFSTYGDAYGFIKTAGFPVLKVPEIKFEETPEGVVAMLETSIKWPKHIWTFLNQLRREIRQMKQIKPSVIVSDSRLSPVFASYLLGIPCILLLHQLRLLIPHRKELTPFKMKLKRFGELIIMHNMSLYWNRADTILVPDFPPPYSIAKENLDVPRKLFKKVEFIGQVIEKRPEELPEQNEIKRELGLDDRPLIYAAIAGTLLEKKRFNDLLMDAFSKFPDKYQIIVTRGLPKSGQADVPVYSSDNIQVYNWVSDRFKLIKAADLVISRAGHNTISECIYYGKPMVLIPTPAHTEHQGNAKSALRMGIATVIQQKDLTPDVLLSAVNEIFETEEAINNVMRVRRAVARLNAIDAVLNKISQLVK